MFEKKYSYAGKRLCAVILTYSAPYQNIVVNMRFNDKELAEIGVGPVELEGRLNHRRPISGNFSQTGFKERWFKLKSNLLFYFRINELGKIDYKQPAGVFVLENSNVQYEMSIGIPFAFSVTFRDEPDKKHIFSGRSESHVQQWVTAIKQATYEYWRSQLIILQTKISARTGKDPLLLLPHNAGTVRNIDSPTIRPRNIGPRSSSFQSHVQKHAPAVKPKGEVMSTWTTFDDDEDDVEGAVAETSFTEIKETNLIDL